MGRSYPAILLAVAVGTAGAQVSGTSDEIEVGVSAVTGHAMFVRPKRPPAAGSSAPLAVTPASPSDLLTQYGHLFGVSDPEQELQHQATVTDELGHQHTTYHQVFHGVAVYSGMLKVHRDAQGRFTAVNGQFYSIPAALSTTPTLSAAEASELALAMVAGVNPGVVQSELVIVDPGWYGDPPQGPHLAYYLVVTDPDADLHEGFFIDAHSGTMLDRWTLGESAIDRRAWDANFAPLPNVIGNVVVRGRLKRTEPRFGRIQELDAIDANRAFDYLGDVYDYYFRGFGRDSYDDRGSPIDVTVRSGLQPPDGQWLGPPFNQIRFSPNRGLATDDFTGHELTHGVTQTSARLIYQNQPGQLNESFSDVFGELTDLFNGNAPFAGAPGVGRNLPAWPLRPERITNAGTDQPNVRGNVCFDGVRWLIFEDTNIGAARDMWNPACLNTFLGPPFPDRTGSPNYVCGIPQDNGGVHIGSSVPNHAFAILTDGQNFNGQNVNGIGPIKAGAVWYRALTVYLTPASDFPAAFAALNQAALDLAQANARPRDPRTGLPVPAADAFAMADAAEVNRALLAVELNLPVACGAAARNYVFVVDTTGSAATVNPFYNQIIAALTPLLDAIPGPDRFAIARFDDYPCGPFGEAGDVPYQLVTPFVTGPQIPAFLPVAGPARGADDPESQIDAVFTALSGQALAPNVDNCGLGVPAGQGADGGNPVQGPTAVFLFTTPLLAHLPGPGKPHVHTAADLAGALVRVVTGGDPDSGATAAGPAGGASGFGESVLGALINIRFDVGPSPAPGGTAIDLETLLAAIRDAGGVGTRFQGVTGDETCVAMRACAFLGGSGACMEPGDTDADQDGLADRCEVECDVDNSGTVDRGDISLIFEARNTRVGETDPRDVNADGIIDVGDTRACVLQCRNPRCAP